MKESEPGSVRVSEEANESEEVKETERERESEGRRVTERKGKRASDEVCSTNNRTNERKRG